MVEIRRLSIDELQSFLDFMGGPAFATNPQWAGCYCQFYLNAPGEGNLVEDRGETNRQKACDRIMDGTMQGYLAFDGEKVIGWMAANKANNFKAIPKTTDEVARVLCFVIDADHQGRGAATTLLRFAIQDLASQGFTSLEAAPRSSDEFDSAGYRGKLSTYLKAGFSAGPKLDDHHVLVSRTLSLTERNIGG
jgi:GNAT superfamily N-acetyltransferase